MCSFLSDESLYPMSGYRAGLPAVESAVTARDETLLYTNNVLHSGVGPASNKAGGENNSEDEGHGLDDRNEDAGHGVVLSNGGVS